MRDAVVQRKNSWYGNQPVFTRIDNPLKTIAEAVATDDPSSTDLYGVWAKGELLRVAKTARPKLVATNMRSYARPAEGAAYLDTPNPKPGTRKDPDWISTVGNLGKVEDQIRGEKPREYNGGHLIAWEFLNEEANIAGNIAPQATLTNQALYRRIERTLESTASSGNGVEVIVQTPYTRDPYTVSYAQLVERGLIPEDVGERLATVGRLPNAVTVPQVVPDTYRLFFLTQTSSAKMATMDKREARYGISTTGLGTTAEDVEDEALRTLSSGARSILATNFDEQSAALFDTPFAKLVYLNYEPVLRPVLGSVNKPTDSSSSATMSTDTAMVDDEPPPTIMPPSREELRKRALEVIEANRDVAYPILERLQLRMGPTQAYNRLVDMIIDSDPGSEAMQDDDSL